MKEFKVGDRIRAFGVNGVVSQTGPKHVCVYIFKSHKLLFFLPCGRIESWHKTPSLKHRKFKKKREPMECFGVNGTHRLFWEVETAKAQASIEQSQVVHFVEDMSYKGEEK